jgi:hypothetical protein
MPELTHTSLDDAYLTALSSVVNLPRFESSPRGMKVREIIDYSFTVIRPTSKPIETLDPERNAVIAEYSLKEMALYESRSNRVEDFEAASKFWGKLANPDGTINSAYGYLIFNKKSLGSPHFEIPHYEPGRTNPSSALRTPWEWAKLSLVKDRDTRQAIMHFNLPEHLWVGNKDVTCTLSAQFFIRQEENGRLLLILKVVMRSQDVWLGLTYDAPWFISLQEKMLLELKENYPTLQLGEYRHTANSLHIYDRHIDVAKKALGYST